ncbi:hypothetical protein HRbin06_00899 [archaeon HR06]|nr:hypothetical protein HRbin06_00899 [archaeon HR06]
MREHGLVLWLNKESLKKGRARIYDKDMLIIKGMNKVKAIYNDDKERFEITYSLDNLLEIRARNFGKLSDNFYIEIYNLIFNNCGVS